MGSMPDEYAVFDPTALFSQRIQRWQPGAIRSLLSLEKIPGMISLAAGKPNPETFPFSEISISLKNSDKKIVLKESVLAEALQYSLPVGVSGLVQWFEDLQRHVHGVTGNSDWTCCIGQGSQELIHRAFQVFVDPGEDNSVLIQTPAYPGVASFLRADQINLVEVDSDEDGLDPDDLERILLEWPEDRPRPKVLYTIPTGSNPTGRTISEDRRVKVLRLAKKYNFMIFEDDAYYYLNFDDATKNARSYLSLEKDINGETGRVVRFDSLSKIVSSGMRLAFATGSTAAIGKVVRITENVNLQPATTTQFLALSLLQHWGIAGFLAHCGRAADFYRARRDAFAAAAARHLRGRAEWTVPTAGMFFWLALRLPEGADTFALLSTRGMDIGVLAVPGMAFMPRPRRTCQLRASYSMLTDDQMDEACRRLARLVDGAWAGVDAPRGGQTLVGRN